MGWREIELLRLEKTNEMERILKLTDSDGRNSFEKYKSDLIEEAVRRKFSKHDIKIVKEQFRHPSEILLGEGVKHELFHFVVPKDQGFPMYPLTHSTRLGRVEMRTIRTTSSFLGNYAGTDGRQYLSFLMPFKPISNPDPKIDKLFQDSWKKSQEEQRKLRMELEDMRLLAKYRGMQLSGKSPVLVDKSSMKMRIGVKAFIKNALAFMGAIGAIGTIITFIRLFLK